MKMATSDKIVLPPLEKLKADAEKWRERLYKGIPGMEDLDEKTLEEMKRQLREFPNNLSQEEKDRLFEAHQKVRVFIEDTERERYKTLSKEESLQKAKEEMHLLGLDLLYFACRCIELYEAGKSVKDVADELDTCEGCVTMILQTHQRL